MRAVVSRVSRASVTVDGEVIGSIAEPGLLVLLGVTHDDDLSHAETMARKLHELRILRGEQSAASAGVRPGSPPRDPSRPSRSSTPW